MTGDPAALRSAIADLRRALESVADAERAASMAAYMRDQFPFLGVATDLRRAQVRPILRAVPRGSELRAAALLWEEPEREFQYVAADLLRGRATSVPDDLEAFRGLVIAKPWWDTVDSLAVTIGTVSLRNGRDPDVATWARTDRGAEAWLWQRRVGILFQLGRRDGLDLATLFDVCAANLGEDDFFMRKAVGWALRDAARRRPDEVRAFVAEHSAGMSGLTRREAMKHVSQD